MCAYSGVGTSSGMSERKEDTHMATLDRDELMVRTRFARKRLYIVREMVDTYENMPLKDTRHDAYVAMLVMMRAADNIVRAHEYMLLEEGTQEEHRKRIVAHYETYLRAFTELDTYDAREVIDAWRVCQMQLRELQREVWKDMQDRMQNMDDVRK